jgi:restriction system protein
MSDETYHFPPDLMGLLIDTIPLLCRSRADVLAFFRGCGVPAAATRDIRRWLGKYEITRIVLTRLNEGGDRMLAQRREVVKRVTQFQDFSACRPDVQLKARGLVSAVRDLVTAKDAVTKLNLERERDRQLLVQQHEAEAAAKRRDREQRETLRRRLAGLTLMTNPQQRGIALEGVLNDIFKLDGLSVRDAFTIRNERGYISEQIDGLISLGTQLILVEAKWHSEPLNRRDVSAHLVSLYTRGDVYGLVVSYSGFRQSAIDVCKAALADHVVVLAEVHEIVMLLEDPDAAVSDWLRQKITKASVDRLPLFLPGPRALSGLRPSSGRNAGARASTANFGPHPSSALEVRPDPHRP